MSEQTKIAWADSTVNFWIGCEKVSTGCANCYADEQDQRRFSRTLGEATKENPIRHWGKDAPRYKVAGAVKDALAFNRKPWICDECGTAVSNREIGHEADGVRCLLNEPSFHRRRIFSLSLGDWLDDAVPIEWLAEMLDTIRQCDHVTWILCTKRPENWANRISAAMQWFDKSTPRATSDEEFELKKWVVEGTTRPDALIKKLTRHPTALWLGQWLEESVAGAFRGNSKTPKNIILLTSVENQEQANKRILELLKIPAARRGLSLEPLLGPVNLNGIQSAGIAFSALEAGVLVKEKLDWLIIGGESGTNARPCNVDWIRSIVAQGNAAGVPTFVKQVGSNPVRGKCDEPFERIKNVRKYGYDHHEAVPYDKKGGDMAEWPADLRVREFYK